MLALRSFLPRDRRLVMSLACALTVISTGCGDDAGNVDGGADSGMDSGQPRDAGMDAASMDAATDSGFADAGPMDGAPVDGAPVDGDGADAASGCLVDGGIECDGDWTGRCVPECDTGECCSPQAGLFTCVPRDDAGACPAADLWVDGARIEDAYQTEWQFFEEGDCAIEEGCVAAPGWRRLLRFGTWTPNTGTADMYLGPPGDDVGHFVYSECHEHYHFDSYARYFLKNADGSVVANGHKQAFCLLDFYQYPGENSRGAIYDCDNQGIQRDWQDVYGRGLDCQWVDVTDVEPGDYVLQIDLNYDHVLLESSYENNTVEVAVTVAEDDSDVDVTEPCPPYTSAGTRRNCGFTRGETYACTPGERVRVGCSSTCGVGSCDGDPILRVCGSEDDPTCGARFAIASNDDSPCDGAPCSRGGDCCPLAELDCPEGGEVTAFHAPYDPDDTHGCTLSAEGATAIDGGTPPDAGAADGGLDGGTSVDAATDAS